MLTFRCPGCHVEITGSHSLVNDVLHCPTCGCSIVVADVGRHNANQRSFFGRRHVGKAAAKLTDSLVDERLNGHGAAL